MKEFIFAALPLVLIGLALAVLAVNHMTEKQKDEKWDTRIAFGAGFGLLMGVTLNSCGLWENHLLGLALGPLWGMAIASLISRKD
ncbi:MAG: hypothetical protein Q4F83_15210 [Eubacteriales bacterium]|nr:hypothetical protein [Eubacteriales bacterium]